MAYPQAATSGVEISTFHGQPCSQPPSFPSRMAGSLADISATEAGSLSVYQTGLEIIREKGSEGGSGQSLALIWKHSRRTRKDRDSTSTKTHLRQRLQASSVSTMLNSNPTWFLYLSVGCSEQFRAPLFFLFSSPLL